MNKKALIFVFAPAVFLFARLLLADPAFACPAGQCTIYQENVAVGCQYCSDYNIYPGTDPSCKCSETQCCQADGSCGPCSPGGQ